MRTLVSERNGRKDYPTFMGRTDDEIVEFLKIRDWSDWTIEQDKNGLILVFSEGNLIDTFKIIDVELVSLHKKPKEKDTFRVYARLSGRCYLDVQATSEKEAMNIGAETDGGDFINEEDQGDWQIESATKL